MKKVKQLLVTVEYEGVNELLKTELKQIVEFAKSQPESCHFYDDIEILDVEDVENQEV